MVLKNIIYALVEPYNQNIIRYIGKSTRGFERPKNQFCSSSLKTKTHKNCWIKSRIADGYTNSKKYIILLKEYPNNITTEELSKAEIEWIALAKLYDFDLTNGTDGGEGGINISIKGKPSHWLGRHHSDETKEIISKGRMGNQYAKGHHHSKETIEKMKRIKAGTISKERKLTWYDAQAIRFYYSIIGISQNQLSKIFNVSSGCVCYIVHNKTYTKPSALDGLL